MVIFIIIHLIIFFDDLMKLRQFYKKLNKLSLMLVAMFSIFLIVNNNNKKQWGVHSIDTNGVILYYNTNNKLIIQRYKQKYLKFIAIAKKFIKKINKFNFFH